MQAFIFPGKDSFDERWRSVNEAVVSKVPFHLTLVLYRAFFHHRETNRYPLFFFQGSEIDTEDLVCEDLPCIRSIRTFDRLPPLLL